jgi:hypothetical protein
VDIHIQFLRRESIYKISIDFRSETGTPGSRPVFDPGDHILRPPTDGRRHPPIMAPSEPACAAARFAVDTPAGGAYIGL